MAASKGTTVIEKHPKPKHLVPFTGVEKMFEEAFRRPFPLLSPAFWPEMNFGEYDRQMPPVDMYEEGGDLVVKADLPGLDKKDIEINVTGDYLTITGERKKETRVEKGGYYKYETSYGKFLRRVQLPMDVDTEKIKAHLEKGILEVRLPKTEVARNKARTISIT